MSMDTQAQQPNGGGVTAPPAEQEPARVTPRGRVQVAVFVALAVAVGAAALLDLGTGFAPNVEAIDAIAGLAFGAFLIDRLLTFVPPGRLARKDPDARAADLELLRLGYGALCASVFVMLTDLRAVAALTPGSGAVVDDRVDRGIAVLALAGGVAGLANLLAGINPQPKTDATEPVGHPKAGTIAPPTAPARFIGFVCVALAAGFALVVVMSFDDKDGLALLGPDKQADGTVALAVRFGAVFLAAAIIEQFVTRFAESSVDKHNRAVILGGIAVVLGVLAARVFDLYLMHNIGFFGGTLETAAQAPATAAERWGDTFVTGVVIAAGTKPVHDLASRIRKAKEKPKPATA